MRHSYGHLAFDGREYLDAPNYPVDKRWADERGYGYHHNASFRTATMGQAATRTYFQPSGGTPAEFYVQDVNIPLQSYGYGEDAPKTDAATDDKTKQAPGGKYDAMWGAIGQIGGILGVQYMQGRQAQDLAKAQAQAAADAARYSQVSGGGTPPPSSGGGMGTVLIVGLLGVTVLGAGWFLMKDTE